MPNSTRLDIDIRAHDHVTPTVKQIQSGIIRFVGAITASLLAVQAVAFPVKQAAAFEKELKNVQKTTGFTETQIASLGNALNQMSTELIASQTELAQIAATAGQLGLGGEGVRAIEEFTESVARASTTFDIGSESLANYTAQILNVFSIPTQNVEQLFSAINEVSNNSVASAEKLIDILKRVGNIAGLTANEVIALAATTQDLGVTSEVAGTTLVKILSNMQSKAGDFAEVMSTSTEQWVATVEQDGLTALKAVLKEISALDTASKANAIRDLFGGGRIFALASKLVTDAANGFELLGQNLDTATQAFLEGQSSIREYAIVASSLSGQTDNLKNTLTKLSIEAGTSLIPTLKRVVSALKEFSQSDTVIAFVDSLAESVKGILQSVANFTQNVGELTDVWDKLVIAVRVFIAYQAARIFVGIALKVSALVVQMNNLRTSTLSAMASYSALATAVRAKIGIEKPFFDFGQGRRAEKAENIAALRAEKAIAQDLQKFDKLAVANTRTQIGLKHNLIAANKANFSVTKRNLTNAIALGGRAGNEAIILLQQERKLHAQKLALLEAELAVQVKQQTVNLQAVAANTAQVAAIETKVVAELGFLAAIRANARAQNLSTIAYLANVAKMKLATISLIGVIRGVGTAIVTALVSPWLSAFLLIGTIVHSFWDQIKSFFGAGVDDITDSERVERAVKQRARQEMESRIDAYKEVLQKRTAEGDLTARIEILFAEGSSDSIGEATRLISGRLSDLGVSSDGLDAVIENTGNRLKEWEPILKRTQERSARLTAELEKAKGKLSDLQNPDTNVQSALPKLFQQQDIEKDIAAIEKALKATNTELELDTTRQGVLQESVTRAKKEQLAIDKERAALLERANITLSLDVANAIVANAKYNAALKERVEAVKKVTDAEEELKQLEQKKLDSGGELDGADKDKYAVLSKSLLRYDAAASEATIKVSDLSDEIRKQEKLLDGKEITDYKAAQATGVLGIAALAASKDVKALTSGTVILVDKFEEMEPSLVKAADTMLALSTTLRDFGRNRRIIDALSSSITGMKDNLSSTLASFTKNIQKMYAAATKGARDAKRDFALTEEIRNDPTIKTAERGAERAIASLEKRLARAELRKDSGAVEYILDQIEAEEKKLEVKIASREAELELNRELERQADFQEQTKKLATEQLQIVEEAAAAQKALDDAVELGGEGSAEALAAQKAVTAVNIKFIEFNNRVKTLKGDLDDTLGKIIELGNVQKLGPSGLLSDTESILPEADQKKYIELFKGIGEQLATVYADGVTNADAAVSAQSNAMDKLIKSFKEAKTVAAQLLKEELGPGAFALLSGNIENIVSLIGDVNAAAREAAVATHEGFTSNLRAIIDTNDPEGTASIRVAAPNQDETIDLVVEYTVEVQDILDKNRVYLPVDLRGFTEEAARLERLGGVDIPLRVTLSEQEYKEELARIESVIKNFEALNLDVPVEVLLDKKKYEQGLSLLEAQAKNEKLDIEADVVVRDNAYSTMKRRLEQQVNETVKPVVVVPFRADIDTAESLDEFDAQIAAKRKEVEAIAVADPITQPIIITLAQRQLQEAQDAMNAVRVAAGREPVEFTTAIDTAPVDEAIKSYDNDDDPVPVETFFQKPLNVIEFNKEAENALGDGAAVDVKVEADAEQFKEDTEESIAKGSPIKVDILGVLKGIQGGAGQLLNAATGGYIRGPGTTTSDSIPAMLSDKEFVMQSKATAHYGVGFMRMVNSLKFDLKDLMPHFNTGGLVQAAPNNYGVGLFDKLNSMRAGSIPKFATGGLVDAASKVTSGTTSSEVNVNLTLGGRRATLRGEKEQVREFVGMLNSIEGQR